jgi:hypothetical protein
MVVLARLLVSAVLISSLTLLGPRQKWQRGLSPSLPNHLLFLALTHTWMVPNSLKLRLRLTPS